MTLSRRRFLTISAGFALTPEMAKAQVWQGRAFGAEISMTIRGARDEANAIIHKARQVLRDVEALFSLYDPDSALARLNANGELRRPDPRFLDVMRAADHAYHVTGGLFDPSVQRLWDGLARNHQRSAFRDTIGWDKVQFDPDRILLGPQQALTFNGIAQGYATDKVAELFATHGLTDVLINVGEFRAVGGPWRLGLYDPDHGTLGTRTLGSGAIATSSPNATPLGEGGHIIHRSARPQWSTVSVEAASATLADSLSTALVLADRDEVRAIKVKTDATRITLVDFDGDLTTL